MASFVDEKAESSDTPMEMFGAPACNMFATAPERILSETGEFVDEVQEPTSSVLQKTALVDPSPDDFETLTERLRVRLREGRGECIYEVGVAEHSGDAGISEDELAKSIETLQRLVHALEGEITLLRQRCLGPSGGHVADFLIRTRVDPKDFMEIRVAVVGNVDAGKSTLLGVLTHGELDNGRGFARLKLFRHKHEIESGRTSSVGNDILGFDATGHVANKPDAHAGHLDWVGICEQSAKVITFIDLAGHEKYLKTTVFGMTGHLPDYCMLMIGANAGIVGMTKEHLGLALALNVPVFVVITKIDMCPENILQETIQLLQKILKSPGCRKLPVMVANIDDVVVSAVNFTSERICPVFQVSNVNGKNLDLLKMFMNLLSVRSHCHESDPAEFQIDETYTVHGVGTVVSGTCLKGVIRINDNLMLGPDLLGQWTAVTIRSVHRKRMPVREVRGGQTSSFALKRTHHANKKIERSTIRKGMVLVAPETNPVACWEFEGEILVLHHPTTISPKYQAMVHCGNIRQTASIVSMTRDFLRTGDKALVRFRFIKSPEYVKEGMRLVFREGRTKAVGNVTRLFPNVTVIPQLTAKPKLKPRPQQQQDRANNSEEGSSGQKSSSRRRGGVKRTNPSNPSKDELLHDDAVTMLPPATAAPPTDVAPTPTEPRMGCNVADPV